MSQMSDFLENKLIDHIFRGTAYTGPTSIWVSLHTANPSDTGGSEVTTAGTGYARASLAATQANWSSTNGTTSGASTGTGGATSNKAAITFGNPTASWGNVTHFALWDAASAGNMLVYGALSVAKTINAGDSVSFASDAITVTFA